MFLIMKHDDTLRTVDIAKSTTTHIPQDDDTVPEDGDVVYESPTEMSSV